jgi:hypothetical protein
MFPQLLMDFAAHLRLPEQHISAAAHYVDAAAVLRSPCNHSDICGALFLFGSNSR